MFYLVCSNNALTVTTTAPNERAIKENHLFQVCESLNSKCRQQVYAEIDFSLSELRDSLRFADAARELGFDSTKAAKPLLKALERALH